MILGSVLVYFPRNIANHVQLVIKCKTESNIKVIQRAVKILYLFISSFENAKPDNINHRYFSHLLHSNLDGFKTSETWVKRQKVSGLSQVVCIHEEELLAMNVQSKEVETLRRMWLGVVDHLPGLRYKKSK